VSIENASDFQLPFSYKGRLLPFDAVQHEEDIVKNIERMKEELEDKIQKSAKIDENDVKNIIGVVASDFTKVLFELPVAPTYQKAKFERRLGEYLLEEINEDKESKKIVYNTARFYKFLVLIDRAIIERQFTVIPEIIRRFRFYDTYNEYLQILKSDSKKITDRLVISNMDQDLDDDFFDLAIDFTTYAKIFLDLLDNRFKHNARTIFKSFQQRQSPNIERNIDRLVSFASVINEQYENFVTGMQIIILNNFCAYLWSTPKGDEFPELITESDQIKIKYSSIPAENRDYMKKQLARAHGKLQELILYNEDDDENDFIIRVVEEEVDGDIVELYTQISRE